MEMGRVILESTSLSDAELSELLEESPGFKRLLKRFDLSTSIAIGHNAPNGRTVSKSSRSTFTKKYRSKSNKVRFGLTSKPNTKIDSISDPTSSSASPDRKQKQRTPGRKVKSISKVQPAFNLAEPPKSTRRSRTPSEWYGDEVREKFRTGDWENLLPRDWIDWWCWRYYRAFKVQDPAFQMRGTITKIQRQMKVWRRRLFEDDAEKMFNYLSDTLHWWKMKHDQEARWPTGLPGLEQLMTVGRFISNWRGGVTKRELDGYMRAYRSG